MFDMIQAHAFVLIDCAISHCFAEAVLVNKCKKVLKRNYEKCLKLGLPKNRFSCKLLMFLGVAELYCSRSVIDTDLCVF